MRANQWRQGLWIGLLLLIMGWLVYLIWGLSGKVSIALRQEREVKDQYDALEARRVVLEADLKELSTPRGQEAAIRESFGVAKPGEEVIVLVPQVEATTTPPLSWWQTVLNWF
ncbi:MAG TPA: septum formation initiator family protein [Candidatus Paceibacterota bacterium]|nr:septum formation initiator family protein [Candidatus Paceibacterota bacterium]